MSSFDNLLNAPLPSANEYNYSEGGDDIDSLLDNAIGSADSAFDEGDDDEITPDILDDIDSMLDKDDDDEDDDDDSDLSELEQEMNVNGSLFSSEPADDDDDDDDNIEPEDIPSPENVPEADPLPPEEDKDADQMMAVVGTPIVIDQTMTAQEAADFLESGDADIAVAEGLLLESDLSDMMDELSAGEQEYTESVFAPANRPYKMTKKARFNQLYELSLQIEAKAHHDMYVPKIMKAYKIERKIKKIWRKKYGRLAARRALKYLRRLQHSKATPLKKAATALLPTKKK